MLILNSVQPLTIEKKPSASTLEFLEKFSDTDNKNLSDAIKYLKDKYIKTNLSYYIDKNFSDIPFTKIEKELFVSIPQFSLLEKKKPSIIDSMMLFLYFEAIIDFKFIDYNRPDFPLMFFVNKKKINRMAKEYKDDFNAIVLPFKTSQTELIKWIKANWEMIDNNNQKLKKYVPDYLPKNFFIGVEIAQLKNQGLTYEQISDQLYEKYPDNSRLADANQIKSIYHKHFDYFSQSLACIINANQLERTL